MQMWGLMMSHCVYYSLPAYKFSRQSHTVIRIVAFCIVPRHPIHFYRIYRLCEREYPLFSWDLKLLNNLKC